MVRNIKRVYTCTRKGKVVIFETNYSKFYEKLKKYTGGRCNGFDWYRLRFKESDEIKQKLEGDRYFLYLQKITP